MSSSTGESLTVTHAEGLLGLQRREVGEVSGSVVKVAGEAAMVSEAPQGVEDYPNRPAFDYLDN